jgi:hypothetical protein
MTAAQNSVGYQGLPAEWSREKRGNEYDANKQMAGLKKEEAMKEEYKEPFEGGKKPDPARKAKIQNVAKRLAQRAMKKAAAMKEGYMKASMPEKDDDNGESDMAEYERYMKSKKQGVRAYDKKGKLVGNYRSKEDAMKFKPGHVYKEETEEKGEYDYEGDMAMSQLKSVITNAQKLHDMLKPDTNLPEWVQSKITLAEDYILTAANYMDGEMNESAENWKKAFKSVSKKNLLKDTGALRTSVSRLEKALKIKKKKK